MNAIDTPHMIDLEPLAKSGLTLLSVSKSEVRVATPDGRTTSMPWSTLIAAATQDYDGLRAVYAALHVSAANRLATLPRNQQGLAVEVVTRTGGATHEVVVKDASGRYRSDLMCSDEGCSRPHRHLAEVEAEVIRRRIRA